ncbi:MAG: hypothetical protein K2H62_03675, partial [Bacteroidales bacterium]|nr:hypothetical protein [Bacteroidales bacterium]
MGITANASDLQAFYDYYTNSESSTKPDKDFDAIIGVIDNGEVTWTGAITVPTDAAGTVSFMAVAAAMKTNGTTVDKSEDIEVSYNVSGDAPVVTKPTFDPVTGSQVDPGTKLTISASDADYIFYTTTETGDPDPYTWKEYEDPISIKEAMTIRAAAAKGTKPPFTFSDVATATYTVTDKEQTDIPKLTLSAQDITVAAAGQAVFSCTMDPQEYTHETGLVGFVIGGRQADDVLKLEYQVVEGDAKPTADKWEAYSEAEMRQFTSGVAPAIPNSTDNDDNRIKDKRLLLVSNGVRTVYYRLTLKLKEGASTAPTVTFTTRPVTSFGTWSTTDEPLATASIAFTIDESAKPTTVAAPVFNPVAGEIEPKTVVEITTATVGAQIAYVVVEEGEEDKTVDLADETSYTLYTNGVTMTAPGTVKAVAFRKYDEEDSDNKLQSEVVPAAYTFPKVAAPTFTGQYGSAIQNGANVEYGALVYINGEGDLYYTTDGTEPTPT